jgi:alpha-D-ribose 1-methylphosphonate 5-triphosphate synthase subunit PhnI
MGYSGVKGGMNAILAAERLVRRKRADAPSQETGAIIAAFRLAVDRIMGEAGLYDEAVAADAFRQAEGDLLEAAHLVRAYRSSLPRLAITEPADPDGITVLRRIVPASRTPDGPQLLGRTTDYTARVLERPQTLSPEQPQAAEETEATQATEANASGAAVPARNRTQDQRHPRRFSETLAKLDLSVTHEQPAEDPEPFDVTRAAARPPAPRSAVLSSMARAETGALTGLWYRSIRGRDGAIHEVTLGEVRHGRLPVSVIHPLTKNPVSIGDVRVTEAEAIEDLDGSPEDRTRLDVGYGLCFGHNERKAIAMSNLDIACRRSPDDELEQVLLLTTDGLDSSGFLEHLKLPHYVTFRSIVDRKLAGRAADGATEDGATEDGAAEDGAAEDGAAEDGAAEDSAAKDSAAENGGQPSPFGKECQ